MEGGDAYQPLPANVHLEVVVSKEVCPKEGLPHLSDDEGPLELATHEAEAEGATAVRLDVAAVGGKKVDAGIGWPLF